ncbi:MULTISPECIES: 3'-5' exonuclease [Streptomyces]|uniref:DNA polymerase III PolC-type n=1 Tax=Streptomyces fradiae ATCC 10745 = DSM 40063 TaxID=1319510 RepID=A0A1Y2NY81_STRFR|nr:MULTISPECIES: 3'-5' exonuclease [Streptomyces]KAF0650341.1 DNA polymerase III subunit epsilon [Streptomyces fradiae ATCC 10745 = DSM 40063]OSY52493.1 DNA polymerase III PolC-type [Streptomyces fradiae ATCC 10745 = DSM 40063]QEV14706.1 3'-5' exonuclease [Streptomyces fradiae ATCC 10745 = DSM 40063]
MRWHGETLVGFDLETTGTEPFEARIVTAAVVEVRDGRTLARREWLADPGVRIPAQAAAIHGISSERAAAEGRPAREVADEVADALAGYWARGVPVVAYNAAFDLTLLTAELRRHGLPSLRDRLGGLPIGPVIDPYTIDRSVDRYRRGKRNLEAVCAEYGVALDGAHEAAADALAAVLVACAIAERHALVARLTPRELHARQVEWYAQWAADFQGFLRRKGSPDAVVDPRWPLREPAPVPEGLAPSAPAAATG